VENLVDHLLLQAIRKFLLECMTEHFEHAVRCVQKWRWLNCVVHKLLVYISKELLTIYGTRFLALGLVALLGPAARQADSRLVWGLAAAVRQARDLGAAVLLALRLLATVNLGLGLVTPANLF
jgi:hypothetical protein